MNVFKMNPKIMLAVLALMMVQPVLAGDEEVWCFADGSNRCSIKSGNTIRKHAQELDKLVAELAEFHPQVADSINQAHRLWQDFVFNDCYARQRTNGLPKPTLTDDWHNYYISRCIVKAYQERKENIGQQIDAEKAWVEQQKKHQETSQSTEQ